ncbi:MAG TPA: glycosyltransferase [Candidatus Saccharimonadales bacterium]|nr:glycosyltransferase [Candidatus Saccharimonadales bacterium]
MKNKNIFHPQAADVSRRLLTLNLLFAIAYFIAITFVFKHGNPYLFAIFLAGEIFHVWQAVIYVHSVWNQRFQAPFDSKHSPSVAVMITVAGEPVDIVRKTVLAAVNQDYHNHEVYILNDGYVAKKANWRAMEHLASELGVICVTREKPGGAKAGNINHALSKTASEIVAVLDADHVPDPDFIKKTVGYFCDPKMGFVQSPQFYMNHATNYITSGAWGQQELFFGPLMRGKNRLNSAFMCGTNMLIRRSALEQAGGMCEFNIAEDFLTSLFMHEKGWKSVYVPDVLAEGLSPEDFSSYYKQQFRWARGSLEVIFRYNPLLRRGLSWSQRLQYIGSASYYLSGLVVLMNALLPLIFFFTGAVVFDITTMSLAAVFIPYIFISLLALQISSNFTYTFRALAFSYGSFWLQIKAVVAALTNQKTSFVVTSKQQLTGNFLYLVIPNILYIVVAVIGAIYAIAQQGLTASVITNIAWAALSITLFSPLILAASPFGVRSMPAGSREQIGIAVKEGERAKGVMDV